jgi:hypothetical protein
MWLDELESALQAALPQPPLVGREVEQRRELPGLGTLSVKLRVDRNGVAQLGHWIDGFRLERRALLHLLCPDRACPEAAAVKDRWARRHEPATETAPPAPSPRPVRLDPRPLLQEVPLDEAGHHCTLRPGQWSCERRCPVQAHPPRRVAMAGWDLFEHGVWLAGGLVDDPAAPGCGPRPRFATPDDARAWLRQQHLHAGQALAALR